MPNECIQLDFKEKYRHDTFKTVRNLLKERTELTVSIDDQQTLVKILEINEMYQLDVFLISC